MVSKNKKKITLNIVRKTNKSIASKLKAGVVVVLKSGGPFMTIASSVPASDDSLRYECVWMDDGVENPTVLTAYFPSACLNLVEQDQIDDI